MVEAPECQVKEFGLLIFMDFFIFSSIEWHYSTPFPEVDGFVCVCVCLCVCVCVCVSVYMEIKPVNPEYSLEGPTLKMKLQYFGHMM